MSGEIVAAIEMATTLTVIGTALSGSQTLSERAFRLLYWIGNRLRAACTRRSQLHPGQNPEHRAVSVIPGHDLRCSRSTAAVVPGCD